MKKKLSIFVDVCILITIWLLFIFALGYLSVVNFYFPNLELAGTIAIISTLLLVIAYTLFWIKRFRSMFKK